MEHMAFIVVNDAQLLQCNISAPKVRLSLGTYMSEDGAVSNLSGRHSLIRRLCHNIVRRAKHPLSAVDAGGNTTASSLLNAHIFSMDVLLVMFAFLSWKDLLHFGYCSQTAYNISQSTELWKLMYGKEFEAMVEDEHAQHIANWKNKFLVQRLQQQTGEDQATKDLINA
eukprot:CAMPEP_0202689664 /NCGR_PEP_ID=MMETSP1385-20130828/4864_1 /ASSEMBLY_ACC=CAM_ASM_000861 /TAXON_ID=933848 /ORGANISM="Elphidium margaritaceum" /LENGTH=168 /DNA_ID=CAMNT_0049344819 /DNA_START=159 /DNA_END=662 /DNA_ORIENTATION=+